MPRASFGPPARPLRPQMVSTATPGARPLSPVHDDFFHALVFVLLPGCLCDQRAQYVCPSTPDTLWAMTSGSRWVEVLYCTTMQ
ncbi:MAG TPA: hypothetical protein DD420_35060 [Streptomyces sp.]|nr:hypothetical protein [Streptomyces sp.]